MFVHIDTEAIMGVYVGTRMGEFGSGFGENFLG